MMLVQPAAINAIYSRMSDRPPNLVALDHDDGSALVETTHAMTIRRQTRVKDFQRRAAYGPQKVYHQVPVEGYIKDCPLR